MNQIEIAIDTTDRIYSMALQIVGQSNVHPKLIPLIMGTVSHRLEVYAIGDMARELSEMKSKEDNENTAEDTEKEVDDGEHIERD